MKKDEYQLEWGRLKRLYRNISQQGIKFIPIHYFCSVCLLAFFVKAFLSSLSFGPLGARLVFERKSMRSIIPPSFKAIFITCMPSTLFRVYVWKAGSEINFNQNLWILQYLDYPKFALLCATRWRKNIGLLEKRRAEISRMINIQYLFRQLSWNRY